MKHRYNYAVKFVTLTFMYGDRICKVKIGCVFISVFSCLVVKNNYKRTAFAVDRINNSYVAVKNSRTLLSVISYPGYIVVVFICITLSPILNVFDAISISALSADFGLRAF